MRDIYLLSPTKFGGITPLQTIQIEFLNPKINFQNIDYLILTSKNGVKALDKISKEWRDYPIFSVGEKTADEVIKRGGKVLEISDGYGKSLINIISSKYRDKRFFYIRPEKVATDFIEKLKDIVEIREEIIYRTVCKNFSNLEENSIVIATSPSTVNCLFKRDVPKDTIFVAIGETTLKAIPDTFKRYVAPERTIESCYKLAKEI